MSNNIRYIRNNMKTSFDQYAERYDSWFIANPNVLLSEVRLVAETLKGADKILSVGCGSGLFESIMAKDFAIRVTDGIEPAAPMAEIARKRGLNVTVTTAEEADYGQGVYDTIMFNGSPGYIKGLGEVVRKVYDALPEGGRLILIDIPKESGYGTLYNLAKALGTWDHPLLEGVKPGLPYPIEFVNAASWRTTAEKADMCREAGFRSISFKQTLTSHPLYSDDRAEMPSEGYDRGDYVAVIAVK